MKNKLVVYGGHSTMSLSLENTYLALGECLAVFGFMVRPIHG